MLDVLFTRSVHRQGLNSTNQPEIDPSAVGVKLWDKNDGELSVFYSIEVARVGLQCCLYNDVIIKNVDTSIRCLTVSYTNATFKQTSI